MPSLAHIVGEKSDLAVTRSN